MSRSLFHLRTERGQIGTSLRALPTIQESRPKLSAIASSAPSPLRPSNEDKRRLLATHFLSVIEPMLRDGVRYSDLSVEQIVRTGGIARSTFYEYFDDKWALLAAMADDVLSQLFEAGRVWWQLADTGTKADLRAAMAPAFAEYQRHKPVLTAVNEATAHDKAIGAYQEMLLDGVIADLKKHIRAGQRKGLAAAGLDADRTAKWLVMMLDRGMNTLVSDANERENAKLLDSAVDIIWRTLYAGCRPET